MGFPWAQKWLTKYFATLLAVVTIKVTLLSLTVRGVVWLPQLSTTGAATTSDLKRRKIWLTSGEYRRKTINSNLISLGLPVQNVNNSSLSRPTTSVPYFHGIVKYILAIDLEYLPISCQLLLARMAGI